MSAIGSKHLINLVSMNSKNIFKSFKNSNTLASDPPDERFQSFSDFNELSSENKSNLIKPLMKNIKDENKEYRESTKLSFSLEESKNYPLSQNISKFKTEENHSFRTMSKSEKRKENFNENQEFIYLNKFDLTNKLLDILKENYYAIPIWTILTLIDFLLRINTLTYFFYKLLWVSKYYYVYLTFLCVCRGAYILMMIKLLFQSDYEDVYIERISKNFNMNDEGSKMVFWNKTIEYDFEFNLDPNKKKFNNNFRKIIKKYDWNKTMKYIGIRLLFILFPNELNLLISKPIYEEREFSLLISIICAWFYKSVEIFTIIPFLALFYFYEDWNIGLNYDFITMILLLADVCKSLLTIIILFIFNKSRTRSTTLVLLNKP